MIKQNTVFVLGAGASSPYSFPSGIKLLEKIEEETRPASGNKWQEILLALGYSRGAIEEFRLSLLEAGTLSIDAFLERRTDLAGIGKSCIALGLIRCENELELFRFGVKGGWYRYIFDLMMRGAKNISENKVSFVTFNYDRSLEHFLFKALKRRNRPDQEVKNELDSIPIIHVYGSLGKLPWQQTNPEGVRDYYATITPATVRIARDKINIISEATDKSEELTQAFAQMGKASRIVFLGFGFHDLNLRRLRVKELLNQGKAIVGTSLGLGDAQVLDIKEEWGIEFLFRGNDTLTYLKNSLRQS